MINEKITIIHTNDLHSHIDRWPRILTWINKRRDELKKQGHEVYVFDIGDFIDRADDNTQATWGHANVELINQLKYDAITIGNNEALALPGERLDHLYDENQVPVLLSNFTKLDGQQTSWSQPNLLLKTQKGTNLYVTGMTADYSIPYSQLGWKVTEPIDTLGKLPIPLNTDVMVLLSHLGLPVDRNIGKEFNFDVVIGAHTHHLLEYGENVNGTLLAAAGKYGNYIGEINLELDENHQVVNKTASVVPTDSLPMPENQNEFVENWHTSGRQVLDEEVIATLPTAKNNDDQMYDFASALEEYFHTDIAMLSTGLFLKDLHEGNLTWLDLLEDLPHSINMLKVSFTGVDLKRLIAEIDGQADYLENLQINGSGFRGGAFGKMKFFGLDTKNINDDDYYTIATLDHYLFLPYFRTIANFGDFLDDHSINMREMFAKYYGDKYPYESR